VSKSSSGPVAPGSVAVSVMVTRWCPRPFIRGKAGPTRAKRGRLELACRRGSGGIIWFRSGMPRAVRKHGTKGGDRISTWVS